MKRGDDYDALKNALGTSGRMGLSDGRRCLFPVLFVDQHHSFTGEKLWRQLLEIHPHLEDKVTWQILTCASGGR